MHQRTRAPRAGVLSPHSFGSRIVAAQALRFGRRPWAENDVRWVRACCLGRSASTPKPECSNRRRVSCSAENASLLYLIRALADSERGRARVVWIGGEPGIGKTRLAEELAAGGDTNAQQSRGHAASTRRRRRRIGHGPKASGPCCRRSPWKSSTCPVSCLERLSALVPDLMHRPATSTRSAALTTASDRYQLFDAVRTLLQRASSRAVARPGSGRPASGRPELLVTAGIRRSRALRQSAPPRRHLSCRRNVEAPDGNDGGACACRSAEDGADGARIERDGSIADTSRRHQAVLTTLSARSTPGPAAIHSS